MLFFILIIGIIVYAMARFASCKFYNFGFKWDVVMSRLYSTSWREPEGFDTNIVIHDSRLRRKVRLVTKRKNVVSWYCCGPTVYDTAHVGNFCSYMHFDIIRRIMTSFFGLNVIVVMNITDIDDKIIARSKELNIGAKSLTEAYEREFFKDLKSLDIRLPSIIGRVTDHIPQIIEFIQSLIDKGYGYITSDGSVYFSVSKFPGYGKFQGSQEEMSASEVKENSQDFALWKSCKSPEEPSWDSPWGRGRPGWHIECSTIASAFLGDSLDLHSGGMDLKFPHHENEEAQCCARFGRSQWANYWIHSGHLYSKANEKMSKSLKNTSTIRDFFSKHSANVFRTFCLMVPYRNNVEFREETIEKAVAVERKFSQFIPEIESYLRGEGVTRGAIDEVQLYQVINETEEAIKVSLSDDFDTPKALKHLLHLVSTTHSMLTANSQEQTVGSPHCLAAVSNSLKTSLECLGFTFSHKETIENGLSEEIINSSVNFRTKIRQIALSISKKDSQELIDRKMKMLEACDVLRNDFIKNGVELTDRGQGTTWHFIQPLTKQSSQQ